MLKRIGSFVLAATVIVCLLVATEPRAWSFSGYIDPGSGLLALQCITSAVAATGYFLRRHIRAFFQPKPKKVVPPPIASTSNTHRDAA